MSRRLRAFVRWMKSQGFQWTDGLEFVDRSEGGGGGVSVKAVRDLREGEAVAAIPKAACLTVKNSGASELIESADLGGFLGLSVALMYEKGLGESSPWAGYLQLLPESECIPLLWTLDEVDRLLQGTELHKTVKEDKGLVLEDWKENILPLVHQLPSNVNAKCFGVEQYFAAKSLVSSRAFEIDDYHGHGMVPLADLFNHKTGAEDVHFTSVPSSHSDDDDDDDDDAEEEEEEEEDSSISDLLNENKVDEEPSSELEGSAISLDDPMVLEMIMVKDVQLGAEIFNTYGLVGNAALLHRYGFAEPDNQFDIVNIDLELVLQWSTSLFTGRYSRARLSLWRNLDYSGCVSGESEYFEVSNDGEPQIELLVLLYIMLLPEEAYLRLDILVSTTATSKEDPISMYLSEKCSITQDKRSEISRDLLLTESVCEALLWLADKRDSLYNKSMKDDIEALQRCSVKEGKAYYSLVLRVCERRILEKLRSYATVVAQSSQDMKRACCTRKRLKRESSEQTQINL
ncbi:unnamed protein product [Linum trigynum]|uniref:N-lysine methyltransferase n=1 Tax=Linum trigynum TaxID=586398 RepID=A0AAV2E5T1_9ROSI